MRPGKRWKRREQEREGKYERQSKQEVEEKISEKLKGTRKSTESTQNHRKESNGGPRIQRKKGNKGVLNRTTSV